MQNVLSSHVSTHRPQREDLMQRGASDNYPVREWNGGLREGNPRNSEVSPKPGKPVVRLRHVSELRACS